MKPNSRPEKKIDTERVIEYLNRAFLGALTKYREKYGWDNSKGSTIYEYQVDYCYLIRSIKREPSYIIPKKIQLANELIAELEQEV